MGEVGQIVLWEGFVDGPVLLGVDGLAVHVGVDLDALGTHILGALDFLDRGFHIVERDAGNKAFVKLGVGLNDFFDLVVADGRQTGGFVRPGKGFDRRGNDVGDLLVPGEGFQHLVVGVHSGFCTRAARIDLFCPCFGQFCFLQGSRLTPA